MAETRQPCVLIVDDEQDIREALRDLIEMVGCSAITAENGAEALKVLEKIRPCLIILDLSMPVMTGEEMVEAMRAKPELAAIPVVISTSAPNRAPAGLPVFPKPIDVSKLCAWIEQTCTCGRAVPAPDTEAEHVGPEQRDRVDLTQALHGPASGHRASPG